jgi:hypothetical protein
MARLIRAIFAGGAPVLGSGHSKKCSPAESANCHDLDKRFDSIGSDIPFFPSQQVVSWAKAARKSISNPVLSPDRKLGIIVL